MQTKKSNPWPRKNVIAFTIRVKYSYFCNFSYPRINIFRTALKIPPSLSKILIFPFLKRIPSSSPLSFPSVIEGRRSLGAFCKFLTRSISNPHSESLKKPFCCLGVIKNELFVLIKKIMKNRAGRSILEIFKFRQNFRKIKCLFFPNFNLIKRDAVIGGIFLS